MFVRIRNNHVFVAKHFYPERVNSTSHYIRSTLNSRTRSISNHESKTGPSLIIEPTIFCRCSQIVSSSLFKRPKISKKLFFLSFLRLVRHVLMPVLFPQYVKGVSSTWFEDWRLIACIFVLIFSRLRCAANSSLGGRIADFRHANSITL